MLNPNWLKTFITLIDTGHFTKTADKLFMTQPGVSQHISKLEQACGHALIYRDKKSFDLTEQGRLIYQYSKRLIQSENALFELLAFDDPFVGECTLACSGALALMLYPKLIDIQVKHAKLVIRLKAAPNYQILNEIQSGEIDVGIVTHVPNERLFNIQEIGKEPLQLVLPAMVNIENNIGNLLTNIGLISHPDAENYLSNYCAQCEERDLNQLNIEQIPVTGYVNQISQILEPVSKGLGFTVLPKSAVDTFKNPELLTVFSPKQPVIETLYLVKKRNRELPARFDIVTSVIQGYFDTA